MSFDLIRKALEKRLATLTPVLPIAYENSKFAPTVGQAYIKANLLPNKTETPTLTQSVKIERGIFQVTVCYPTGDGSTNSSARVNLISNHFPAGLVLTEGVTKVRISEAPAIAQGMVDGAFWVVPVSISFICIN